MLQFPPNENRQDVVVTAQHIAAGIATDHALCPIALAIKELWPHLYVTVGANCIHLTNTQPFNPSRQVFTLSILLQAWISHFDNGRKMGPICVHLDFTSGLARLAIANKNGEFTHA